MSEDTAAAVDAPEVDGADDGFDPDDPDEVATSGGGAGGGRLRIVLLTICTIALLAVAGTIGWLVRGNGSSGHQPNAADIGFAQDMALHHTQAVTMAGYERDNTTDPTLKVLAFDIETSQQFQIGEMQGWLDTWGISRVDPQPMEWMGAEHASLVVNGLMPGMATPAQIDKLESLHGRALDKFFLQLMIRHHQGGVPMAQYAEQHASEPYLKTMAENIVAVQSNEIVQMEQLLRHLGGSPLPPPRT